MDLFTAGGGGAVALIFAPTDGAVSTVLGRRVEWLTDPGLALPAVSAVTVWMNVGYVALFFLAGILGNPATDSRWRASTARPTGNGSGGSRYRCAADILLRLGDRIVSAAQVFDMYALDRRRPGRPHRTWWHTASMPRLSARQPSGARR